MTTDTSDRIAGLVHRMLEIETSGSGTAQPILTATLDLTPGSSGQPPSLRTLGQAVRYVLEEDGLPPDAHDAVEHEAEALEEAARDASERGALGLIYIGAPQGDLSVVELASPVRSSFHAGEHPWLFDLARAAYLDRPVALVTADLHTMDVVRVRYGAPQDEDSVDWPAHYLSKKSHRTGVDARGGAPGRAGSGGNGPAGASGMGGPGHSYSKTEPYVEEQRNLFANEAAEHLAKFVQPGDLLIVAGVDEARSQLLGRLPDALREGALQLSAPIPTEDERDRLARLREHAERAQLDAANAEADRWFEGAHGELALAGVEAVRAACEQGRVGTVILHQDAVTHFGTAEDARLHESPVDSVAIEETLRHALRQGAEPLFTEDARVLEQHGGVLAIARF